jgi:hypothetical protein
MLHRRRSKIESGSDGCSGDGTSNDINRSSTDDDELAESMHWSQLV